MAPVLAEPMLGACSAARSLFGFPTVSAWCEQLPFGADAFDAAWCLGVLCTTENKEELLRELRRVLVPQGRLGLLVLVQRSPELPEQPAGNSFPTEQSLTRRLMQTGFVEVEHVDAAQIAAAPLAWQARADRVEEVMGARHGDHPQWQQAVEQQEALGRLMRDGHIGTRLVHAVAY